MLAGESSLHIAVILGDLEAVQLLLKNGANINQRATGRFFLPEDQKNNPVKETNYSGEWCGCQCGWELDIAN